MATIEPLPMPDDPSVRELMDWCRAHREEVIAFLNRHGLPTPDFLVENDLTSSPPCLYNTPVSCEVGHSTAVPSQSTYEGHP